MKPGDKVECIYTGNEWSGRKSNRIFGVVYYSRPLRSMAVVSGGTGEFDLGVQPVSRLKVVRYFTDREILLEELKGNNISDYFNPDLSRVYGLEEIDDPVIYS